jgi:hypothetical protein
LTPEIEAAIEALLLAKREHAAAHVRAAQLSELFTSACNERNARMEEIYKANKALSGLLDERAGAIGLQ